VITTISFYVRFDPADRLLDNTVRVVRGPGFLILGLRNAEEEDCTHPFVPQPFRDRRDSVDRIPELPGHGIDRARCREILIHEKRGNQIVLRERDFTQERLDVP